MKESSVHGNKLFVVRRRPTEMSDRNHPLHTIVLHSLADLGPLLRRGEAALGNARVPAQLLPTQVLTAKRRGRRRSRSSLELILPRTYDKFRH
jgi:hypothetical protein